VSARRTWVAVAACTLAFFAPAETRGDERHAVEALEHGTAVTPSPGIDPMQIVHVPASAVFIALDELDFGEVTLGMRAENSFRVENTGQLEAVLHVESSDRRFTIATPQVRLTRLSKVDLLVRFEPDRYGDASGTISITSNDPDRPLRKLKVKGSSTPSTNVNPRQVFLGDDQDPTLVDSRGEGKGCRLASSRSSSAGGAFLCLAAVAFFRRRRAV